MNVCVPARVQVGGKLNEWPANVERNMSAGSNYTAKLLTFNDQPDLTEVVEVKSRNPREDGGHSEDCVRQLKAGQEVWVTGRASVFDRKWSFVVYDVAVSTPADAPAGG